MPAKPVERHFSFIWYMTVVEAVVASLPLELFWWGRWWLAPARGVALFALGQFWGAEFSAQGVKDGYAGTMTAWTYSRIGDRPWRVAFGVWLSVLIGWRIAPWLGVLFLAWLPLHYYRAGIVGPVDRAVRWIGAKLGIGVTTS